MCTIVIHIHMKFKKWFSEMAHVIVPSNVNLQEPCAAGQCRIGMMDMKFEEPPQVRDSNGRVLNQGSKFVFKQPDSELFGVVDQGQMLPQLVNKQAAIDFVQNQGYVWVPDNWWKRAQAFDLDGNIIKI